MNVIGATRPRKKRVAGLALGLVALTSVVALITPAGAGGGDAEAKPTIVLVHGAWADSSSWNPVMSRLQRRGFPVIAPANPLRGLPSDSAYLSSILETITGPVVLVGHSYGGMVTTNAATSHSNVKALVYIAAFVPDEGESLGELAQKNPGSELTPENLVFRPHPAGVDVYVAVDAFREVMAADVPARQAALMAAGQRPLDAGTLAQPSGEPAWRAIPSWYLVATEDHAIPPATQRFMAARAGAATDEVRASHVAMLSKPDQATDVILAAVRATS